MAQTIKLAVLTFTEPGEDDREVTFASLDGGENYLPVARAPETPEHVEQLAQLFEGDGNFRPMTWAPGALRPEWWPEKAGCKSAEHDEVVIEQPVENAVIRTAAKAHACEGDGAHPAALTRFASECPQTIPIGFSYVEYLETTPAYQSGSRHCLPCAREFGLLN